MLDTYTQAKILKIIGDYEKALENFTKAIECNPGRAILHAKRAKYA